MTVTNQTRIVWTVEGEPFSGSLQQWANDVGRAPITGVAISPQVWVWSAGQPVALVPQPDESVEADGIRTTRYTVGEASALARTDLRR